MTDSYWRAASHLTESLGHALRGDAINAVRAGVQAALDLVPVHVARQMLDDEAVRRANMIADLAELAKFGGGP